MSSDFIAKAATVTDRLRQLDQRRVVFGSSRHAYRFNPPLSMQQTEAFESTHKVSLPLPYRRFITELGNGGVGPFYGIMPLEPDAPHLLQSFPGTKRFQLPEDDNDEVWDSEIPGSITLAEYGCGIYMLLVVHGEASGQVWVDARFETGIWPITNKQSTPLSFNTWWLNEMAKHLERFEKMVALMESGTTHEEIHKILDHWHLQLLVDETMLSIMDQDPAGEPRVYTSKPWGRACGLVEDYYGSWLSKHRRKDT